MFICFYISQSLKGLVDKILKLGFPYETGKGSLISSSEAETGLPWMCAGPSCFLSSGDGCVGNFLSCRKGVKDPLEVPGVRCD